MYARTLLFAISESMHLTQQRKVLETMDIELWKFQWNNVVRKLDDELIFLHRIPTIKRRKDVMIEIIKSTGLYNFMYMF